MNSVYLQHRNRITVVLAIILAAFAIRVVSLGAPSLWYDEGYTAQFAQHNVLGIVTGAAQLELNTPLHYLVLHGWMRAAGQSEFSLRLLSVFAGVLTVVFCSQCLQTLRISRQAHWLGIALVALSPVCISAAQEVRMYGLVMSLCCCSQWLWLRWLRTCQHKEAGIGWCAAWCAISLMAFATHVLAALVFSAQLGIMLLFAIQKFRRIRRWPVNRSTVLILLACGAAMGAWTLFLVSYRQDYGTSFSRPLAFWPNFIQSLDAQVLPRALPEAWVPAAALIVAVLLAIPFITQGTHALASAGVCGLSLIFITAFCAATGKFAPRYASIVAPLFFVALSQAMSSGIGVRATNHRPQFSRLWSLGLGCLSLISIAISLQVWRSNPIYQQEDYRSAAAYLRKHMQADEAVLLVSGHQAPVFSYYFGPDGWNALPADAVLDVRHALDYASASHLLNAAVAGRRGAWLLLWQEPLIDPTFIVQGLLRRQAHKLLPDFETVEFNGLRLLHFSFDQPYEPMPEQIPPTLNSRVEQRGAFIGLAGLGCHQFRPVTAGSRLMEVACFWHVDVDTGLPSDLKVSLRLVDANGQRQVQVDQNLGQPYGLPYFAYDKVMTSFYFIELPELIQAGTYELQAIPYTPSGEIGLQVFTPVIISKSQ